MVGRARKLWIVLTATFILLACAPFASASPTAAPTFDENLFATYIAGTETAIATRTAPFITPSATPTLTRTPTKTPRPAASETASPTVTFIFYTPSVIPSITQTPTLVPPPTFTKTSSEKLTPDPDRIRDDSSGPYRCKIISQEPEESAMLGAGVKFVMTWVVMNNGTAEWDHQSVDLMFHGGNKMHIGASRLDLKRTVPKRQTISLSVVMVSPRASGTYSATWRLMRGMALFCPLTVKIKVK